jgi:hypothetical protein
MAFPPKLELTCKRLREALGANTGEVRASLQHTDAHSDAQKSLLA